MLKKVDKQLLIDSIKMNSRKYGIMFLSLSLFVTNFQFTGVYAEEEAPQETPVEEVIEEQPKEEIDPIVDLPPVEEVIPDLPPVEEPTENYEPAPIVEEIKEEIPEETTDSDPPAEEIKEQNETPQEENIDNEEESEEAEKQKYELTFVVSADEEAVYTVTLNGKAEPVVFVDKKATEKVEEGEVEFAINYDNEKYELNVKAGETDVDPKENTTDHFKIDVKDAMTISISLEKNEEEPEEVYTIEEAKALFDAWFDDQDNAEKKKAYDDYRKGLSPEQIVTMNEYEKEKQDAAEEAAFKAIETNYSVDAGNSVEITGNGKDGKEHKWTVDDGSIASVSGTNEKATATGMKKGIATVTHTYKTGGRSSKTVTETFTVKVTEPETVDLTVMVDRTLDIKSTKGSGTHTWKSSNASVATVSGNSKNAVVTGKSVGYAMVTHSWKSSGFSSSSGSETYMIKVLPKIENITPTITADKTSELMPGDVITFTISLQNTNASTDLKGVTVKIEAPAGVVLKGADTVDVKAGETVTMQAEYTFTEDDLAKATDTEFKAAITSIAGAVAETKYISILLSPMNYSDSFSVKKVLAEGSSDKGLTTDDEVFFDIYVRNESSSNITNVMVEEKLAGAEIIDDNSGTYTVEDGQARIKKIMAGDYVAVRAKYVVTAEDVANEKGITNYASATYMGITKQSNGVTIRPESLQPVNVYVYMKVGGFSKEALSALGLPENLETNKYDYAPVGVLTVDGSFFAEGGYSKDWATKQYAMLRDASDWDRFFNSIMGFSSSGMVDTGGYNYSRNNGNGATVEQIALAKRDIGKKSGTGNTALFTQDGSTYTTEYGFASGVPQLHLDCVFDTVKVNFVGEDGKPFTDVNGNSSYDKDYVKGQHVGNPGFEAQNGYVLEYYHEGTNTKWNFAVDTVDDSSTNIVVKVSGRSGGTTVQKVITNATENEDGTIEPFNVGDTVTFNIYVKNTGNYTSTNIVVEDMLEGAVITSGSGYTIQGGKAVITSLEPDQTITIRAKYVTKKEDAERTVKNIAVADPNNAPGGEGEVEIPVEKSGVKVTVRTEEATYNGKEHKAKFDVSGLPEGYTYEASSTDTITDAGEITANVTTFVIKDSEGKDVTDEFEVTKNPGTIKIKKAALKIKTESAEKEYDGDPLTNAKTTISGLVNNETATVTATGSQTAIGESTNTYEISWGTAKASNYSISEELGKLKVTPFEGEVKVTVSGFSGTYDGTEHKATVKVEGLPKGYTVEKAVSNAKATDATTEPIEAKVDELIIRNEKGEDITDELNLNITESTISINKAKLTITTDSAEKVYDGTALTSDTAEISGLKNGETATVAATGTQTAVGSSINTYSLSWGTAKAANYEIEEDLGTLEVTEFSGTITVTVNGYKGAYDGQEHGATVTVSTLPSGYTVEKAVSNAKATNASTVDAKVDELIIRNAQGEDVTDKLNIDIDEDQIVISKKQVWIVVDDASKTYGAADPAFTGTVTGVVAGEDLHVTYSRTNTAETVGTYSKVIEASFDNDPNYDVTVEKGDMTINAKSIQNLVVNEPENVTYDGDAHQYEPVLKDGDKTLVKGVDYTVEYNKTDFTNVTGAINVTIKGKGNYAGEVLKSYQITPKDVTISVTPASKKYGAADPEFTGTVTGLVNASDLGTISYKRISATQTVAVYKNDLTAEYRANTNYNVEVVKADFTIEPASIVPSVDNKMSVDSPSNHEYDGQAHKYVPEVKNDGTPLVEGTDYTVTYTDAEGNTVTDFTNVTGKINVTITGTGNYSGEIRKQYEITAKPVTISVNDAAKVYGAADPTFTGTVDGLISNNDLGTVTYVRTNTAEAHGTYYDVLEASYTANSNYIVSVDKGDFTINKKPVSLLTVEEPADVTYNGYEQKQPVVVKDGSKTLVEGTDYTVSYTPAVHSGDVTVTITGIGNYAGTATTEYTINKAEVTIKSEGGEKAYDGTALTNAKVEITSGAFAAVDNVTFRTTGTITNVGETANTIEVSGGNLNDYIITKDAGTLKVTKSNNLVIDADGVETDYDGEEHKGTIDINVETGNTITYSTDGGQTWTDKEPSITDKGEIEVTVKVENPNYETKTETYTLKIDAKAVTINVNDASKVFGNDDPAFSGSVVGLVNDNDLGTIGYFRENDAEARGTYPKVLSATYTPNNNYTVTVNKGDFEITASDSLVITLNGVDAEYNGQPHQGSVSVNIPTGTTIEYSVDGQNWSTTIPTITDADEFTVYVKATNDNYATKTATMTYKIDKKSVTIDVTNGSKVFGEADPTFTGSVNGLINDGDLGTVTYIRTNTAEAKGTYNDVLEAVYTANDNYRVVVNKGDFTISAKAIDGAGMSCDTPEDVEYDGNPHQYHPVITDNGTPLVEGTDYTVTYNTEDFTNVGGTITVTITGTGNYEGTITKTYEITPKDVTISLNPASKVYGEADPQFTANITGEAKPGDLDITYIRTNTDEHAGTYDDVITAVVTNPNYNIKVEPADFTIQEKNIVIDQDRTMLTKDPEDVTYDGEEHKFIPELKDGNTVLVEGTDYTVTYTDADGNTATDFTNVTGTITVTITGKGDYTGTITVTYEITKRTLLVVTDSASKVYDGTAITAGGHLEGLADKDKSVTMTTTGSQTSVGSVKNAYKINWGTVLSDNYKIEEALGTLTITEQTTPIDPAPPVIPTPTEEVIIITENTPGAPAVPVDAQIVKDNGGETVVLARLDEQQVERGAYGLSGSQCVLHIFILFISAITSCLAMFKIRKDNDELQEALDQLDDMGIKK